MEEEQEYHSLEWNQERLKALAKETAEIKARHSKESEPVPVEVLMKRQKISAKTRKLIQTKGRVKTD